MRKVAGIVFGAPILLGLAGAGIEALQDAVAEGEGLVPALMLLALPVLAVGILAAALLKLLVRPLRDRNTIVAVIALVVSGVVGVGVFVANKDVPVRRPDAVVTAAVRSVCAGEAVAAAGRLQTDPSRLNHLVVLDPSGAEFGWTGKPSVEWRPLTIDDVELVACIERQDTLTEIEVCKYNGPSTRRYTATREFRVIAARTGAQLARISIRDQPGRCPAVKSQDLSELKGSVDWGIVADHLASLVTTGRFVDPDPTPTAAGIGTGDG